MHAGDEPDVLGEDVDAVLVRVRDGDLELAREVRLAVEGSLVDLFARRGLVAVDEDLPVRVGGRAETPGQVPRDLAQPFVGVVALEFGTGDDVAHDVAAGAEGGHQVRVDRSRERSQSVLQHAVELDRLTGGETDGAVGDVAWRRRRAPATGRS